MDYPTVSVRWSAPIPLGGADASPLPSRGGVYEILVQDEAGVERVFAGETEDLRRTFIAHAGGTKGAEGLRRAMISSTMVFRYWECEVVSRRLEVVAALADEHFYEYGHDDSDSAGMIRLIETY